MWSRGIENGILLVNRLFRHTRSIYIRASTYIKDLNKQIRLTVQNTLYMIVQPLMCYRHREPMAVVERTMVC